MGNLKFNALSTALKWDNRQAFSMDSAPCVKIITVILKGRKNMLSMAL